MSFRARGIHLLCVATSILLSFLFLSIFHVDSRLFYMRLLCYFLIFIIVKKIKNKKNKDWIGFFFGILLVILEIFAAIFDPERQAHCASPEDAQDSTARSLNPPQQPNQPAAENGNVNFNPAPPAVHSVPHLQGVPIVFIDDQLLPLAQDLVERVEPRVNLITEQSGRVIGNEEAHFKFLRSTAYHVIHQVVPLNTGSLGDLQELSVELRRNPTFLDTLIRQQIQLTLSRGFFISSGYVFSSLLFILRYAITEMDYSGLAEF